MLSIAAYVNLLNKKMGIHICGVVEYFMILVDSIKGRNLSLNYGECSDSKLSIILEKE